MDSKQYGAAIRLSTMAAVKAGVTLPEIIGTLELAKINIERTAYQRAVEHQKATESTNIETVNRLPNAGL